MWFGTFLDAEGNFFDTTHFPNSTPAYPFRGTGCYLILGRVIEEFGSASVEVVNFVSRFMRTNKVYSSACQGLLQSTQHKYLHIK